MISRLIDRVRRRRHRSVPGGPDDVTGRVCGELAAELPDEDLAEDLADCLDLYEMGTKPRCEEVEYLGLVREALDRIARGR